MKYLRCGIVSEHETVQFKTFPNERVVSKPCYALHLYKYAHSTKNTSIHRWNQSYFIIIQCLDDCSFKNHRIYTRNSVFYFYDGKECSRK